MLLTISIPLLAFDNFGVRVAQTVVHELEIVSKTELTIVPACICTLRRRPFVQRSSTGLLTTSFVIDNDIVVTIYGIDQAGAFRILGSPRGCLLVFALGGRRLLFGNFALFLDHGSLTRNVSFHRNNDVICTIGIESHAHSSACSPFVWKTKRVERRTTGKVLRKRTIRPGLFIYCCHDGAHNR